jgi:hypothetical protein
MGHNSDSALAMSVIIDPEAPGFIRPNPENSFTNKIFLRLLLPEAYLGWPQDDFTFGWLFHHWCGMSEILRYIGANHWRHPQLCPDRYPQGTKTLATAIGVLWKVVWKAVHRWSDSVDALFTFESLTREAGGLLSPGSFGLEEGPHIRIARMDRQISDKANAYISRASGALRRGENPYLVGSISHVFIQFLLTEPSQEKSEVRRAIADAITGVSKALTGSSTISDGVRYKKLAQSKPITKWFEDRHDFYLIVDAELQVFGMPNSLLVAASLREDA